MNVTIRYNNSGISAETECKGPSLISDTLPETVNVPERRITRYISFRNYKL